MNRVLTNSIHRGIAVLALLWSSSSDAASATAAASATVITPIAISSTQDLSFGSFAANDGGTVMVDARGQRSASGTVALATGSAQNPASFLVTGTSTASYAVTLPPDATVTLQDTAGNAMAVGAFASGPSGTGILANGEATVHVYATLTVGRQQRPGFYSGSFPVTVEYN